MHPIFPRYLIDITYPMVERAARANFEFIAKQNDWDLGAWDELPADTQVFHRRQALNVLHHALDADPE